MSRLALDELHAQVLLQFLQLRGECRLGDEAALRGAPEMTRVRHSHEVPQILQLEVRQGRLQIECIYRYYTVN